MTWEPRVLVITVPTAGTPVTGAFADRFSPKVIISKLDANTDDVYYGGSDYDATHRRLLLGADILEAPGNGQIQLSALKFDAAVGGEGFGVTYFVPAIPV